MNTSSSIFSSLSDFVARVKAFAGMRNVRRSFDAFQSRLKAGSRLLENRSKMAEDLSRFDQANADIPDEDNMGRKRDARWAKSMLWATFLFEAVLSYKGSGYFLETFLGLANPYVTTVMAVVIAFFAVTISMRINHFSKRYENREPRWQYYLIVVGSYLLVLIIPIANLCEGFNTVELMPRGLPSNYLFFNIVMVFLTLGTHIALITLSEVFIEAETARMTWKKRGEKAKKVDDADKAVQSYAVRYESSRQHLLETSREFVGRYRKIQEKDAEEARKVMAYLDVYLIWSINRIYGAEALPYPQNEEGHTMLPRTAFTPELKRMAELWERLDTITISTGEPAGRTSITGDDREMLLDGDAEGTAEKSRGGDDAAAEEKDAEEAVPEEHSAGTNPEDTHL